MAATYDDTGTKRRARISRYGMTRGRLRGRFWMMDPRI
jgi:hypothetical protein